MRYLSLLLFIALLSCYGRFPELNLLESGAGGFRASKATHKVGTSASSHCHLGDSAVSREPVSQSVGTQKVHGDGCCLKGVAGATFKLSSESPLCSLVLVLTVPKSLGLRIGVSKIASSKIYRPPDPYLSNSVLLL